METIEKNMLLQQITCDACGTIVSGRQTPYIGIKGGISFQWTDASGEKQYRFLTDNAGDIISFCDEKCFAKWVATKTGDGVVNEMDSIGRAYRCSRCGEKGHNARTCTVEKDIK